MHESGPGRSAADAAHMSLALELAVRGRFHVEPNPTVGAVVVSAEGEIVGRGWHARFGGPHAEVAALADAGARARGATLYCTLEPCDHTREKKTPPCAPDVVAAGIRRVVIGASDADVATTGRAQERFRAAGVEVADGVLERECAALIERFAAHLDSDLPWTIAKWAMSADGRIADDSGASRWITGEAARRHVHEQRGSVDAVVVGRGTVIADDPQLTCRLPGGRSPVRVVLDTLAGTPTDARVVTSARETPTWIVCTDDSPVGRRDALVSRGVEIVVTGGSDGHVDVLAAFRALRARGLRRVLLEAGGELMGACLRAGVVHQVEAFIAPLLLGGEGARSPLAGAGWPIAAAPRLESARVSQLGADALLQAYWPRG